jgi:hypothetical protein
VRQGDGSERWQSWVDPAVRDCAGDIRMTEQTSRLKDLLRWLVVAPSVSDRRLVGPGGFAPYQGAWTASMRGFLSVSASLATAAGAGCDLRYPSMTFYGALIADGYDMGIELAQRSLVGPRGTASAGLGHRAAMPIISMRIHAGRKPGMRISTTVITNGYGWIKQDMFRESFGRFRPGVVEDAVLVPVSRDDRVIHPDSERCFTGTS